VVQLAEHENAQLIRKGYDAFSRGDLAALSELFSKDIQWHEAGGASTPMAGDFKGQDAVFGMFGQLIQQTAEFRVTLEEIVADEHQAVAIHEVYARRGSTTYRSREAIVFHLLAGKVTDAWHTVPDVEAYDLFWASTNELSVVEQNIANCRRGYAAFAAGDIAVLNETLDENIVWHVTGGSPLDGDYIGRDATYSFFAQLAQETGGTLTIELHDVLANEEHVTALCNMTATRKGKTMTDMGVQVFHVRDGKVTEAWFTTADAAQTLEFWKD
jgi:ketosteroid isomerase-like protein